MPPYIAMRWKVIFCSLEFFLALTIIFRTATLILLIALQNMLLHAAATA